MVTLLVTSEGLPGAESLLTSVTFIREHILKVDRLHVQTQIILPFHDFAADPATERSVFRCNNILFKILRFCDEALNISRIKIRANKMQSVYCLLLKINLLNMFKTLDGIFVYDGTKLSLFRAQYYTQGRDRRTCQENVCSLCAAEYSLWPCGALR